MKCTLCNKARSCPGGRVGPTKARSPLPSSCEECAEAFWAWLGALPNHPSIDDVVTWCARFIRERDGMAKELLS